jgi:hypothetical protein
MPGDTTRTPLRTWRRDVVRATVLAYRKAMGEGLTDWQAGPGTLAAYLAAGGDPERAERDIPEMIAAAARDHGEWFWRPAQLRIEREERFWRRRGIWPPPMNRAEWPPIPDDA